MLQQALQVNINKASKYINFNKLYTELMSPKNLSCAATSTSSLYCTWLPSEVDLDLDFEIRNYAFSYRLADGFDYYPGYGTTLGSITILPSTTLEYSITGLQPYGGYIIELEASLFPVIESGYSDSSVELIPDEVISITTVTTTNPASKNLYPCRLSTLLMYFCSSYGNSGPCCY